MRKAKKLPIEAMDKKRLKAAKQLFKRIFLEIEEMDIVEGYSPNPQFVKMEHSGFRTIELHISKHRRSNEK